MKTRADIQILRGFSVLMVVLFHFQVQHFENGFLGVDVFFVISGYLMALLYDKGTVLDFYKRRLDRLLPAYLFTILLTLVCAYFYMIPVDFGQLTSQSAAGLFFLSNIYHWNQNSYFDKSAFNPLLNLWSLAVEVQFYLIVPFLYKLIRYRRWLFFCVFLISLVCCILVQTISPKTSFFLMPFRIWEFLIGAWFAWNVRSPAIKIKANEIIQFVLMLSLAASLFVFQLRPDAMGSIALGHPSFPALAITLLTGLVINIGMPILVIQSAFGRLLGRIGDYSYSVYLVHFPIIVLVNYAPFGGTRLLMADHYLALLAVVFTVMASYSFHKLFEKKFSRGLNLSGVRFALMATVAVASFALADLNFKRYTAFEQNIFAAWTDRDTYRCGKIMRVLHPSRLTCQIGDGKSGQNILFVGNSHADSIKKTLAESAASEGFTTHFVVANDPLLGSKPNYQDLINTAVQDKISAIVMHYSNVYQNQSTRTEMLSLIKGAKDNGIKLVMLGPVPTYEVQVPKAMFEGVFKQPGFITNYSEHLKQTVDYRQFASGLEASGVSVYDPAPLLCPSAGNCLYSTTDMKPLYFDKSHLTLTGAAVLKPLFDAAFKQLKTDKLLPQTQTQASSSTQLQSNR